MVSYPNLVYPCLNRRGWIKWNERNLKKVKKKKKEIKLKILKSEIVEVASESQWIDSGKKDCSMLLRTTFYSLGLSA